MSVQADNRATVERFWSALDDGPPRGERALSGRTSSPRMPSGKCLSRQSPRRYRPGRHLIGHFIDWFFLLVPDLRIDSLTVHDTTTTPNSSFWNCTERRRSRKPARSTPTPIAPTCGSGTARLC